MAIDPVRIDFQVGGVGDVEKAFQTVDKIMGRLERSRKASGDRAVRQAKVEAGQVADAHVKTTEAWMKRRAEIGANSVKLSSKAAAAAAAVEIKESKRSADQQERDAKRVADMKAKEAKRASDQSARESKKAADASAKEAKRASDASARESKKSAAQTERDEEQKAKKVQGIRERSASMAGRLAERQAREEARATNTARGRMDRAYGRVGGLVGGSVGKLAGTAMTIGAGALALGGGLSATDAVMRSMAAEKMAIAVSNDAYIPGETKRTNPKDILAAASAAQGATNVDKTELLAGLQKYVNLSSDLSGGMANLGEFGKLSKATGTDIGQLMETAGTLRVQNKHLGTEGMMNLLRGAIGQGKKGAISFADLAAHAGEITATSSQYGGDQALVQQRLLGVSQLARRVADPAEAATAVNKLATDVASHATGMEAAGVKVRDKNGLLDPSEIISNLMLKTGGDIGKLKDLGIGERSMKLFNAAGSTFKEAGGGARGAAAVKAEILGLEGAGYSKQDVDADFGAVMASNAEKFDRATTRLREAMEAHLIPYIERFSEKLPELLPKIERVIDGMDRLATFALDNPYAAIPAIIAASVAKDLAAAGIGAATRATIVSLLSGATTAGAAALPGGVAASLGPGGALVAGGALAGAAVLAGGALGGALGYHAVNLASEEQLKTQKVLSGQSVGTADMSPEQKEARLRELTVQRDKAREGRDNAGPGALVAALGQLTGQGKELAEANQVEKQAFEKTVLALNEEIRKLAESIKNNPGGSGGGGGGSGGTGDPKRNQPMGAVARGGAGGGS